MRSLLGGNSERLVYGPASLNAPLDNAMSQTSFTFPRFEIHCPAFMGNVYRGFLGALIVGLYFVGCPIAILLAVVPIVIAAFECHTFRSERALPHVGKEVFKLLPAFTNFDTSSPVRRIGSMRWILASLLHSGPRKIKERTRTAMRTERVPHQAWHCATATSGASTTKIDRANWTLYAAFASAQPLSLNAMFFNNEPSSKSLIGQVKSECIRHVVIVPQNAPKELTK